MSTMRELIQEINAEAEGLDLAHSEVIVLAGLVYLANTMAAALDNVADAIQFQGEMDTRNMLMPMRPLDDEYGDD